MKSFNVVIFHKARFNCISQKSQNSFDREHFMILLIKAMISDLPIFDAYPCPNS